MAVTGRKQGDLWAILGGALFLSLLTAGFDYILAKFVGHQTMPMATIVVWFPLFRLFMIWIDSRSATMNRSLLSAAFALTLLGMVIINTRYFFREPSIVFAVTFLGFAISTYGMLPVHRAFPVADSNEQVSINR